MDSRYKSGTSLERTDKEELLDRLESELGGEFDDEFYLGLQKLTVRELRLLVGYVRERADAAREEGAVAARTAAKKK